MNDTNPAIHTTLFHPHVGQLALLYCGARFPLQVCQSAAGFYIGTMGEFGPCSRESMEYFKTRQQAVDALNSGAWTQRMEP